MQIATWNVNSLKVRLPQVLDYLSQSGCDVLALQELKMDNASFPLVSFTDLGYSCVFNGQKTYNGVAIISKLPITDVVYDIPGFADEQKRVISATVGDIRVICVYVVNGEAIISDKFKYKLRYLGALHEFITQQLTQYPNLVLLGDFNIAPEDIDVYDPEIWFGQVLCSQSEREAFAQLKGLGLHDSFRVLNQDSGQYTWWDYRNFAFRRKMGLRIDHILVSDKLLSHVRECRIEREVRKNERPSDHAPLLLNLTQCGL